MFRPYRTLKLKVPRPCCPWCQTHLERIEQKLQAMEQQIQELSTRLATPLGTTEEAETLSAGLLGALQVFGQMSGLTYSHQRTDRDPQSEPVHQVGAFSAFIAALDRLGGAGAADAPPNLVPPGPKTLSPHQLTQISAPQIGSELPPA